MILNNYMIINGERKSRSEVAILVDNTADNIVLTGFTNVESLVKSLYINAKDNKIYKIKILDRLLEIFKDTIYRESKKIVGNDRKDEACNTVMLAASEKLTIICQAMNLVISEKDLDLVADIYNKVDEELLLEDDEEDICSLYIPDDEPNLTVNENQASTTKYIRPASTSTPIMNFNSNSVLKIN